MTKKHRLFFALEPADKVRQEILAVQKRLKGEGRMIPAQQFHITLAFLGQQPTEKIPNLCAMASGLHFDPCTLVLDRLGTFGGTRVLWLGATLVPSALQQFHQALLDELRMAEVKFDGKAWKPHLTLYRRLRNKPGIMETVPVNWRVNQYSLLESINVENGVEYLRQGSWKSGGSGVWPRSM